MPQFKNIPTTVNGDMVIGFTSTQLMKDAGWADRASISSWYQEDTTKNHIGMVELYTNYAQVSVPMMKDLFSKRAMLEVNGMDGTFTYDIPVYKDCRTVTMIDKSTLSDFPGIDESVFEVNLSRRFNPGDVLTYDKQYGEQFVITEDAEVIQEGDTFTHMAHLASNDGAKWFPKDKLKAGIQYWKVGHVLGEFSEKFSGVDMEAQMGTMTCEFVLGNHRGVETFYTMYADKKNFSGATVKSREMWDFFMSEQEKLGKDDMGRPVDMMYIGSFNKATGRMKDSSLRIGAALEYLVILENIKIEANQLLFQKGGIIKGNNGTKRLNEGVWHQLRRGRKITYARPGGITREHIRQAAAYLFQTRPDLLPHQRRIKFKAGSVAYRNMMEIFQEEFRSQLASLSLYMGTDRALPSSPITGPLDGLTLNPVILKNVYIPEIGMVEIEYDPSLDYQVGADRFSRGFFGQGASKDSGSLVIWDASSDEYSNARTNLPAGTKLVDGGTNKSNIYYVKPEGENMWWGYEQGRWNPNKASDIMSSAKTMSREFWVHSTSAAWVRDISKFLIIELKR